DKSPLVSHTLIAANRLAEIDDPFSIIPAELGHDVEVAVAKTSFLRARRDPAWREMAAAAHADHPENKHLARFAAEAAVEEGCDWAEQNRRSQLPTELAERVKDAASTLSAQLDDMLARPDVSTYFDPSL